LSFAGATNFELTHFGQVALGAELESVHARCQLRIDERCGTERRTVEYHGRSHFWISGQRDETRQLRELERDRLIGQLTHFDLGIERIVPGELCGDAVRAGAQ
jgi:hypothetical protein